MNYPIIVEGLSVSYDRKRVLSNVYLHVEEGKLIGVLEQTARVNPRFSNPSLASSIIPTETSASMANPSLQSRKRIAYVPQRDEVDWTFPATVKDIVLMGRFPSKTIWQKMSADDHRIAHEAMEELSILDLADRQIGALSGGQQQRVFLARALCQEADILMLDEPFVGVDITTEEHIIRVLRKLSMRARPSWSCITIWPLSEPTLTR